MFFSKRIPQGKTKCASCNATGTETYYEDVRRIGWPVPHTIRDYEAEEVIYIDHNHLHMVGNVDTGCDAKF